MMDLDLYDGYLKSQEDGIDVEIIDPSTGEATGAVIRMCGPDTRQAFVAHRAAIREAVKRLDGAPPSDEIEDYASALGVAKCVIGWSGIKRGEAEVPFSEAAALELFLRHVWVQRQCDVRASDRGNFPRG